MAQVFGVAGEEWGDQQVFQTLEKLPDKYVIYAQPKIPGAGLDRYPDYVIVEPERGVIVLEVKDWVTILESKTDKTKIRRSSGTEIWETSPVKQARDACHDLMNSLQKTKRLVRKDGYHKGKLKFPVEYAAFLPHQPGSTITQLEQVWSEGRVFGKNDLDSKLLENRLDNFPYHFFSPESLDLKDLELLRAVLDPSIVLKTVDGRRKGVLDLEQEKLAKEALRHEKVKDTHTSASQNTFLDQPEDNKNFDKGPIQSDLPEEATSLRDAAHVRLVRGYAGTGKTDVLLLRANYLYEKYPDKKILVTTFNRPVWEKRLLPALTKLRDRVDVQTFDSICKGIYEMRHGTWNSPQNTKGVISKICEDGDSIGDLITAFGPEFICDEIIWMKETGFITEDTYVSGVREGRGKISGRRLSPEQKKKVFEIFKAYHGYLGEIPAFDWVDLHEQALNYLSAGTRPKKLYDVVLIDEGQHFAPTWISVISHLLAPGGNVFIGEDPSQSVYRVFSWKERGVDVVGRTRWLRIPYRNTRQIFNAAYHLAKSNPVAMQMLKESGADFEPDLESEYLRDGDLPFIKQLSTIEDEKQYVIREVRILRSEGFSGEDIAILHNKKYVRRLFRDCLPKGVVVDSPRRQTGMEYRAVFLPRMQDLFDRDTTIPWTEDKANQQYVLYTAMTRARDKLYFLYEQKWPNILDPIKDYCQIQE